jgi:hypothetical protein
MILKSEKKNANTSNKIKERDGSEAAEKSKREKAVSIQYDQK